MFEDKYLFVIVLAYSVTFLILLLMCLTTWLSAKKVKKISENIMHSEDNTQNENI